MKISTRYARIGDIPDLRHIWITAFGNREEADFFSYCFNPEMCIVAVQGDMPVAAGHLIPAGKLACGEYNEKCAMIYGLAVLPDFRNCGIGKALTDELISFGRCAGYPAVVLCPSDDSLFMFYNTRTELRDWFYISERRYEKSRPVGGYIELVGITPDEYGSVRENLLVGRPHIELNSDAISYQARLCQYFGGGLFRADTPNGSACATIEAQPGGSVWVKELLAPVGSESDIISSIAAMFPAAEHLVRTPVRETSAHPETRRFGMLAASHNIADAVREASAAPWFGLAFD
jgi:GNAT superfamily N-acetyltransferase